MLVSQATALNGLLADLLRRSSINLGDGSMEAGERYSKLALMAQDQSRMTLETLCQSRVRQPPKPNRLTSRTHRNR